MKLTSLGSGSSGNAFLVETDEHSLLLDCGVGARTIYRALAGKIAPSTVVVSHEHSDHIRALQSVVKRYGCEVVATAGTLGAIGREAGWRTVRAGARIEVDSLAVSFIGVSHDAAEPCGFFLESPNVKVALVTDLGCMNSDVLGAISAADVVVLESNYDEVMLSRGRYPAHLKRRIRSAVGHLSNDDCAAALAEATSRDTLAVWLSHLSHNNNTPEAAVATSTEALLAAGKQIPVAALARFESTQILPYVAPPRQANLFDF